MKVVGTTFCFFDEVKKVYKNFYNSKISVELCGCRNGRIVEVELIEVPKEEAEFWAWHDLVKNNIRHIYKELIPVKMCDLYFFEKEIAAGEGRFIPLKIREIEN